MSIFSFERLLGILETVCEIILAAIGKLKPPVDDSAE